MGIGSVTSLNNMSSIQKITSASTDPKIKSIQNEITNTQQQMQKLSSKEELSVNEKTNERKKLQKEISSLNTELKQHQEKLRKSQKNEIMKAELQEDNKLTNTEKSEDRLQSKEISSNRSDEKNLAVDQQQAGHQGTIIAKNSDGTVILKGGIMNRDEEHGVDTGKKQDDENKEKDIAGENSQSVDSDVVTDVGLSSKEIHSIVSADSSVQQANRQGSIIARIKDGVAILKGEISQEEIRGANTEKKQDELERMEKKEQRAMAFRSALLGEANSTVRSASKANSSDIKSGTQVNVENNAFINALKSLQEEGAATQQSFHISFSN